MQTHCQIRIIRFEASLISLGFINPRVGKAVPVVLRVWNELTNHGFIFCGQNEQKKKILLQVLPLVSDAAVVGNQGMELEIEMAKDCAISATYTMCSIV